MKLINHNKNNHYDIDTFVMSGTITMSQKEYKKVYEFLMATRDKAILKIDTYTRDSLENIKHFQNKTVGDLFSFGVVATKLIAEKYGLKNYKKQNYGIKII